MAAAEVESKLQQMLSGSNLPTTNLWLASFQHSPMAWPVAFEILGSSAAAMSASGAMSASVAMSAASQGLSSASSGWDASRAIFAAQTLKQKVQHSMREIDPSHQQQLLSALISHCLLFSNGPPQVLTQLFAALAAFLLHCPAATSASLSSLLSHAPQPDANAANLGQGSSRQQVLADESKLLLLTVVAEEAVDNKWLPMTREGQQRRHQFLTELLSLAPLAASAMLASIPPSSSSSSSSGQLSAAAPSAASPGHSRQQQAVLRCLLAWVKTNFLENSSLAADSAERLMSFALSSLQETSLQGTATEALSEVLSRQQTIALQLLPPLLRLRSLVLPSIPPLSSILSPPSPSSPPLPPLSLPPSHEPLAAALCLMLSEFGSANASLCLASPAAEEWRDEFFATMMSFVSVASLDREMAAATLPFWSAVCSAALSSPSGLADNSATTSAATSTAAAAREILRPAMLALLTRARISGVSRDDIEDGSEDLDDFRAQLEELLAEVAQVLEVSDFLSQLRSFLSHPAPDASRLEAALFALCSASDLLSEDPAAASPFIEAAYVAICNWCSQPGALNSPVAPWLCRTASKFVSSFAASHLPSPTVATGLMHLIGWGLSDQISAICCSAALSSLCESAPSVAADPAIQSRLLQIAESLDSFPLDSAQQRRILSSITAASCHLPDADLSSFLNRILGPLISRLSFLASQRGQLAAGESRADRDGVLRGGGEVGSWQVLSSGMERGGGGREEKSPAVSSIERLGAVLSSLLPHGSQSQAGIIASVHAAIWPSVAALLGDPQVFSSSPDVTVALLNMTAAAASAPHFSPHAESILAAVLSAIPHASQRSSSNSSRALVALFLRTASSILERQQQQHREAGLAAAARAAFSCLLPLIWTEEETDKGAAAMRAEGQERRGTGDVKDGDESEAVLRLASTCMGIILERPPLSSDLLPTLNALLPLAAAHFSSPQRTTSSAAFTFASAVLVAAHTPPATAAAAAASVDPHALQSQAALLNICVTAGTVLLAGVVRALLVPSAASRIQKIISLLLDLTCCCQLAAHGSLPSATSAINQQLMAAFLTLPSGLLQLGEAERAAAVWSKAVEGILGEALSRGAIAPSPAAAAAASAATAAGMAQQAAVGGEQLAALQSPRMRSFRRILREFVEQHKRDVVG